MSVVEEVSANPQQRARELASEAAAQGMQVFVLDGTGIVDASAFHAAIAELFSFPAYYGANFDALDECLTDLSWLEPSARRLVFVLPESFEEQDPRTFRIALDVLADASERWQASPTPLDVVVLRARPRT